MGWFAINIMLPIFAPLALLYIAGKTCTLIEPFASRVRVLNAVKDGQLSWVGVVFSASTSYSLYIQSQTTVAPTWAGPIFFFSVLNLMLSSMLSVLGALFPVVKPSARIESIRGWFLHYRLFCISALMAATAAALHCVVHFALEAACK